MRSISHIGAVTQGTIIRPRSSLVALELSFALDSLDLMPMKRSSNEGKGAFDLGASNLRIAGGLLSARVDTVRLITLIQ